MPRNKRHVDQQLKKEEIEAVAMRLFKEHGYEKTSMVKLAKAADITPNTIYWYYENKDEVLIAVLNRLVLGALQEIDELKDHSLEVRILTLIERIESFGSLMSDVHVRVAQSEVVEAWHNGFHEMVEQFSVVELVRAGVDEERALLDARMLIYIVEGLLVHPHQLGERQLIIRHALNSMLSD